MYIEKLLTGVASKTPERIYITSDNHYSHFNNCRGVSKWEDKAGCRDFNSIEEMNDTIVNNINSMVGSGDILLHLGDWSFGGKENIKKFRDRIVCANVITLFGNHHSGMRDNKDLQKPFLWVGDYLEFRCKKTLICCFHYPLLTWNEMNNHSICLTGHEHTKINKFDRGKTMDVGLDSNNYNVYSLPEILKIMESVPVKQDHHEGLR